MPRRKRQTEEARPRVAEVINLTDHINRRLAERAAYVAAVYVVAGGIGKGDVVLCTTEGGGYTFAVAEGAEAEDAVTLSNINTRLGRPVAVCGRVVLIEREAS